MKTKEEILDRQRAYFHLNKDKCHKLSKVWREKNKEKLRLAKKKYYQENKERYREYYKEWRKKNPEKGKEYRGKRKNLYRTYQIKRRITLKFTDIDVKWLNQLFEKTTHCELCNDKLDDNGTKYPNGKQLDHITPLAVGGAHTKNNVRFICYKCNVRRPRDGRDTLKLVVNL